MKPRARNTLTVALAVLLLASSAAGLQRPKASHKSAAAAGAKPAVEPAEAGTETGAAGTCDAADRACTLPASRGSAARWIEKISDRPRAFVFHNFLSQEEADHIVAVATPSIKRTSVIHANGTVGDDPIRTSWGTFITRAHDDIIRRIDMRVAEWTHLAPENAEDMQVLRYQNGQKYGAHWDETDPSEGQRTVGGGRSYRVATVLMYLSDAEFGGETAFPRGEWLDEKIQTAGKEFSDCGKDGIAALARKGNAILFWDMLPSGDKLDRYSMHTGCPVIRGTKWSATKWIHGEPFGWSPYHRPKTPEEEEEEQRAREAAEARRKAQKEAEAADPCRDLDPFCEDWAFNGECDNNKAFMGQSCRRSCALCCLEGDVLCERKLARRRREAQEQQGPGEQHSEG